MKNKEFEKHCEGLQDIIDKHEIGGFYFLINDIKTDGNKSAAISCAYMDELPEVFRDIFMITVFLNKDDASKEFKKAVAKLLDLIVKLGYAEFKDEINHKEKKGEENGQ